MAFRQREPERRAPLRAVQRPIEVDIERTGAPQRRSVVQTASMVFGWTNLIIGLAAFLAPLMVGVGDGLLTAGPGLLFGVFAMNWVHALVHVIVGIAGIAAAKTFSASHNYFVAMAIVFGLLLIAGIVMAQPGIFHVLGMSHNIADNWLHGLLLVAALVFAFTDRDRRRRAVT